MKKILFVCALLATLFMSSCTEESPELNTYRLVMNFESTTRLRVLDYDGHNRVIWRSSDEFVATVDQSGRVVARHVGKAYIVAMVGGEELICDVYVDPIINVYQEPILAFGSSKNYILQEEWRELKFETSNSLEFYGRDVDYYIYMFDYNRLVLAGVTIDPRSVTTNDLSLFLDERYQFVGEDGPVLLFERGNVGIDVYTERVGICVDYFELRSRGVSRSKKVTSEKSIEGEEIMTQLRTRFK